MRTGTGATLLVAFALAVVAPSCGSSNGSMGSDNGGDGGGNTGSGSGSGGSGGIGGTGSGGSSGTTGSSGGGNGSSGAAGSSGSGGSGSSGSSGGETTDAGPPSCPVVSGAVMAGGGMGSASQTVAVDGTGSGRTYDGMGAISGGGGNSAMLMDYPEPQRTDILDYLFKPGYGANVQLLKVEIGGDADSTCGSEASHEHTKGTILCNSGYEWWLMQEAKKRNPNIVLYADAWGEPGWINDFWSQDSLTYHMDWLQCAKTNGLTIDYMSGWNESGYDKTWFENMASAMQAAGYTTKMACADETGSYNAVNDMASDPAFKAICAVVANHYVCGGDGSNATTCDNNSTAIGLGVPLWQAESGSQDYDQGAPQWARTINREYIDGKWTATMHWPIVASNPKGLGEGPGNCTTVGLIVADTPWSGSYSVGNELWVLAHTTQFANPGTWAYIDDASGYLGGDRNNGSYVTLKSTTGSDYSIVIETAVDSGGGPSGPQTVAFQVTGGLGNADVHVWQTQLQSTDDSQEFVHAADITPDNGTFWITLQPNYIYTVSTRTDACKSSAQPAQPTPFALPHSESFESPLQIGQRAPFFGDESGSFQVAPCGGGRSGQCYRQMDPVAPTLIFFNPGNVGTPYTLIGSFDWTDYTVSVDVLLESSGSADLIGRYTNWSGYWFSVSDSGQWQIANNGGVMPNSPTVLASGTGPALGTNAWHTLTFSMKGATLTGSVDGTVVGMATDSSYQSGPAGLSAGFQSQPHSPEWLDVQYDNFSVTSP